MTFREWIDSHRWMVLDGGMGSGLISRGLTTGTPPERWTLENGDEIKAVHRAFVEAGSDAVQTNTFGANPIRLAAYGLDDRCEEINRKAVALALSAQPEFVIGDIGPTGEYLPPVGAGAVEAWASAFECQASALAAAGVDAFHVETMSDVREARTALDAIRRVTTDVPVMVSMTFERKKRGFFTVMGNPLIASLRELADAGADVVGANCSIVSGDMLLLVEEVAAELDCPIVIQPNAGLPESGDDGRVRYSQTPDEFAEDMTIVARSGVSVLGGCCGTDERFIAALRLRLEAAS